jgi:hypothetical protein
MTTSFISAVLAFLLMFFGVGMNMATAGTIDLVGRWDGTADIATDEGFSTSDVNLNILSQQGIVFSGTMRLGNDTPFNVNGVVDKKAIRITGSASIFEASISGHGVNRTIHGTGSRLESVAFPSATTVFDLYDKEHTCEHSGGTVGTQLCCASAGDFANMCSIGGCGCSPASSHEITVCNCGPNKCFDGMKCVSR